MHPGKGILVRIVPRGAFLLPREWERGGEQLRGSGPQKRQRGHKALEWTTLTSSLVSNKKATTEATVLN